MDFKIANVLVFFFFLNENVHCGNNWIYDHFELSRQGILLCTHNTTTYIFSRRYNSELS